jgi:hypothetical protein
LGDEARRRLSPRCVARRTADRGASAHVVALECGQMRQLRQCASAADCYSWVSWLTDDRPCPGSRRWTFLTVRLVVNSLNSEGTAVMDDETKARLDYIENQLAGNPGFAYVPWSQRRSIPDEVLDLVRAGKKVQAVMTYARTAGISAPQAKAAIDAIGE